MPSRCENFSFQTVGNVTDNVSVFITENVTSATQLDSHLYPVQVSSIVIYSILWPMIIICGIFGNILNLFLLGKTDDSGTISKFLKSLAVADTLTLIVHGMQMVYVWEEMYWPHQYRTWLLSSHAFYRLSRLSDRISKIITVAISVERLIAVTTPLQYKFICTPKRITVIIVIIYVITTSTCLPLILDVFIYEVQASVSRIIHSNMGHQYRKNRLLPSKLKSFHFLINLLVFDFIPIPAVFVCNIIIIIYIRKSNFMKSATTEVQRERKIKDRQLVKLLVIISMLFLALAGPSVVYIFLLLFGILPEVRAGKLVLELLLTLSLVNSSINFIVCAVMNKKYQAGFIAILCCCCRDNDMDERHIKHSNDKERQPKTIPDTV